MPADIQYNTYNTATVPILYTPDFSFLKYVLDKKNQNFEQGMSKSIAAYSDVLNAPLTKTANKESRDAYIKNAQDQIKKIAGSDLSLQQNVQSAIGVFSPFWDDKDVVNDYNYTRQQTIEMQNQYAMQNSSDEKIRDQFSTIPVALMQNRMEKIKNAKKGDMSVYDQPVVKSTPFYNITKEAMEFIKDNDYKIESVVTRNGRVETYVNGAGTVMTFQQLVEKLRGSKYQAQDEAMGQYNTISVIKDIQKDYESKGIKISEEEAKKHILDYHKGSKIDMLEKYNVNVGERIGILKKQLDDLWAKNDPTNIETIAKLQSDILQLKDDQKDTDKEIQDWQNPNSTTYLDAQKSISRDPSSFFSSLYRQTEINETARLLASNQSTKVEFDQAYWKGKELEQAATLKHEEEQNKIILKQMEIDSKRGTGGGDGSDGSDGSGSTGLFGDSNNDGIDDSKQKSTVNVSYNVPTVDIAKASIETTNDKVGVAKQFIFNQRNQAVTDQFELFQTEGAAIVGSYIQPTEAAIIKAALASQNFKDPSYKTAFTAVVKRLKDAGKIQNQNQITGPITLMSTLASEIEKDMEEKLKSAKANRTNPDLRTEAMREAQVLFRLKANQFKLNDLYAKEQEFDKSINAEMSKPGYENIRVAKGDGTFTILNTRHINEKYGIPQELAARYLNGTLELKSYYTPTGGGGSTGGASPYTMGTTSSSASSGPGQVKKYYYEDSQNAYDFTDLVNAYGESEDVKTKMDVALKKAGSMIESNFVNVFNTGNMGKVYTYGSDTKQEVVDMGDMIASDVLGPGMKYEMVNDSPIVNFSDNDNAKEFAKLLINRLSQSPKAGLTSVNLYTIGQYNPAAREVRLKYSLDDIQKLFTDKERAKYQDEFTEYANSGEGLVLQLRPNETVKGFPTAASVSFYDMLLSQGPQQHITNDPIEEQLGVKYDLYKDGTGKILYKAAVEVITPDPKSPDGYTTKMVDPYNPSISENYTTYRVLPPGTDLEEFVNGLKESSIKVFGNNSKIISNVTPAASSIRDMYSDLWKQYLKIK